MSGGQVCAECGNLFYGRECDLCGPMARTFERMKVNQKQKAESRKQKLKKRDWEAGQDRAVPPERD